MLIQKHGDQNFYEKYIYKYNIKYLKSGRL